MDKMVFFNIAWMNEYKGITPNDRPVHGGKHVEDFLYGDEVYNFQAYRGKMYGFVEVGWKPKPRCINIAHFGASKREKSVSGVLVVWVARHPRKPHTLVVGWYKNATIYRQRQKPPEGSNRTLPDEDAKYFAEADKQDCYLIPPNSRDFLIGRGRGLFGQKNIWYADSQIGIKIKSEVLAYIREREKTLRVR